VFFSFFRMWWLVLTSVVGMRCMFCFDGGVMVVYTGPFYALGRLSTVPRDYEPFKAYNISLDKKNPKINKSNF
jgi:hypothetical protein